jgi:hypothetical protein
MALALLALVGGYAVARVAGGRWSRLVALPWHAGGLVAAAVVAQLLGGGLARLTGTGGWYAAGLAVSAIAAMFFCVRNLSRPGVPLVAMGLFANALVVVLNGAMPVSAAAASRAGVSLTSIAAGQDPRHVVAADGTTARWLGDAIPLPLPVAPEVVSPGDVLVAAGLGELVVLSMCPRRRRRTQAPASDCRSVALTS